MNDYGVEMIQVSSSYVDSLSYDEKPSHKGDNPYKKKSST